MALTKAELALALYQNVGINRREAMDLVEAFFEEITHVLASGETIKLSGFGVFELLEKPERPGRNPKTGEIIPIKARRVVTFHPSSKLRKLVEDNT